MRIKVLFFASLREELGVDCLDVHLATGSTTCTLLRELTETLGEEKSVVLQEDGVRVAVNHEMGDDAIELHDDDEVAYFPPITGG